MPEPEDHHPLKKFFGRHKELFAALTSGFVGALALGTSTYNVYLQRQQVRASVWPHVTMDAAPTDDAFSIVVRNRGVGPARIERVTVDGKPADDWMGALKTLLHEDPLPFVPDSSNLDEEVLTPGMELTLVKIPGDPRELIGAAERTPFAIETCYCSTLDDCWTVGLHQATKAVPSCPPDPKPFVEMTWETKKWIHEYWRKKQSEGDGGKAEAAP